MNFFGDLSAKQKQSLGIGLAVMVAVVGVAFFVVKGSVVSLKTASDELAELNKKIAAAEKLIGGREQIVADSKKVKDELESFLEQAPPKMTTYAWASEIVYFHARGTEPETEYDAHTVFEVSGVDEVRGVTDAKANGIALVPYSVRVTGRAGYECMKTFTRTIKANSPLVRVTGIEISAASTPDVHDVQIFVQWPFCLGLLEND